MTTRIEQRSPDTRLDERVARLEVLVAQLLRQHDVDDDVALMRALVISVGGHVFNAQELRQHARIDVTLAAVLGRRSAKAIGRRLRRLANRPMAGYVLRKTARDNRGSIWCISTTEMHADAGIERDLSSR